MLDASILSALSARVERLERESRRLRILLFSAFVLVLVLGAAAGSFAQQKNVTFKDSYGRVELSSDGLYIYDTKGYARLALYLSSNNQPVIRMRDSSNKDRVYFGITSDSHTPRIEFEDPAENERLYVGLSNEGTGLFRAFTAAGKQQTSLEDDGLTLTDDNASERAYIGTSTSGDGILDLWDSNSNKRIFAGTYTDGTSGFTSYTAAGAAAWSSP